MKCTKCGGEVEAGNKFCPYCGNSMLGTADTTDDSIFKDRQDVFSASKTSSTQTVVNEEPAPRADEQADQKNMDMIAAARANLFEDEQPLAYQ